MCQVKKLKRQNYKHKAYFVINFIIQYPYKTSDVNINLDYWVVNFSNQTAGARLNYFNID
jgi:hypothetical protein